MSDAHKGQIPWNKGKKGSQISWLKGRKMSEEHRRKLSMAHKGVPLSKKHREALKGKTPWNKGKTGIYSEETKRNMGKAKIEIPLSKKHRKMLEGRTPWNKGKVGFYSAEQKRKMGLGNIGRTPWNKGKKGLYKASKKSKKKASLSLKKAYRDNPELRKKLSNFQKGRKKSEEHKIKIGLANKGRKHSDEFRQKMREARAKRILPKHDTKIEKILQNLLNDAGIKFETHRMYVKRGLRISSQPDIFIKPDVCIFADGDYWHANPAKYSANSVIHKAVMSRNRKQVLAKDKWTSDKKITNRLEKQGYKVLRLWEYDINNSPKKCLQKIKKIIK